MEELVEDLYIDSSYYHLDDLQTDLKKIAAALSSHDRRLLDEQATFVREMEKELQATAANKDHGKHAVPQLEPGIKEENDNMPQITRMQTDLLVNSLVADFARVASLQITNSVGR